MKSSHHPQPNSACTSCAHRNCDICPHQDTVNITPYSAETNTAVIGGGALAAYVIANSIRAASMRYGRSPGTVLRNPLDYFSQN